MVGGRRWEGPGCTGTNHQRYRQGMSTTSSASDENWPGLCALSPRGQHCPQGAPSLIPHPRHRNLGWAMRQDCITAWKVQLPACWNGLGGTACPRGQSKGTESNCLRSEGAALGSCARGRPAGAWAAGLGLYRCCDVWGAVRAFGGKRPQGHRTKPPMTPGFEGRVQTGSFRRKPPSSRSTTKR